MNPMLNKGTGSLRLMIFPALIFLGMGCHKPEPPEYYGFQDLRITQAAGQQTSLATTIKFYNPNPFSIQLKRAEMDVFVNGKLSGHSLLDTTISIPRKDTFYVPVSLQLDLHSILSNALQMLLTHEAKITLDGRVRLKRDGIPFSVPFHYEANQDLNSLIPGN